MCKPRLTSVEFVFLTTSSPEMLILTLAKMRGTNTNNTPVIEKYFMRALTLFNNWPVRIFYPLREPF